MLWEVATLIPNRRRSRNRVPRNYNGTAGHSKTISQSATSNTGILDIHRSLEGATGTELDRDDYAGPDQPFYGHEGNSHNRMFCVSTPVDSDGVEGVRFRTRVWYDNVD